MNYDRINIFVWTISLVKEGSAINMFSLTDNSVNKSNKKHLNVNNDSDAVW